jgi:hypothetical protein
MAKTTKTPKYVSPQDMDAANAVAKNVPVKVRDANAENVGKMETLAEKMEKFMTGMDARLSHIESAMSANQKVFTPTASHEVPVASIPAVPSAVAAYSVANFPRSADGKRHPVDACRVAIVKINDAKIAAGTMYKNKKGVVDKGVHVVWDGYNAAIANHFGITEKEAQKMIEGVVEQGYIVSKLWKGGAKVYLPEDISARAEPSSKVIEL